mgnify:CR=1 FL=1
MQRDREIERTIPRDELLYNQNTITALYEEYGPESEIKRHVKTGATMYEIRAALKYWLGVTSGEMYRMSQRVLDECAAVDAGRPVEVVR